MTTQALRSIWREDDGVTAIEYALIASLIYGAIVLSIRLMGQDTAALWAKVQACVSYAAGNGGACA